MGGLQGCEHPTPPQAGDPVRESSGRREEGSGFAPQHGGPLTAGGCTSRAGHAGGPSPGLGGVVALDGLLRDRRAGAGGWRPCGGEARRLPDREVGAVPGASSPGQGRWGSGPPGQFLNWFSLWVGDCQGQKGTEIESGVSSGVRISGID